MVFLLIALGLLNIFIVHKIVNKYDRVNKALVYYALDLNIPPWACMFLAYILYTFFWPILILALRHTTEQFYEPKFILRTNIEENSQEITTPYNGVVIKVFMN